MGLFGAISTSNSGLNAHAFSIENSAGNIANSQTTGFKRKDVHFTDHWPDASYNVQRTGGVTAYTRGTGSIQGDVITSDVSTHVAIKGDGYFIVDKKSNAINVEGAQSFTGDDRYTRRGDFTLDKDGYLVNGSGYYLKGLLIDPETRSVQGNAPEIIKIDSDFLDPLATTAVDYRLNLPADPTTHYSQENDGANLINVTDYTADPTTSGTGVVNGDDAALFIQQSVSGGSITTYNSSGSRANMQLRWAKVSDVESGGEDKWNLFYMVDSEATGTEEAWLNTGEDFIFNSEGKLDPQVKNLDISGFSIDGIAVGDIELRFGDNGVTQYADSDGLPQVNTIKQNGYPSGELVEASIQDNRLRIHYSNGEYREIAHIALAAFNGDNFLSSEDGGTFQVTQMSGTPVIGALGTLVTQSLESSNVDMAEEFGKISKDQMGYVSNSRVSSVAVELMRETLNILG